MKAEQAHRMESIFIDLVERGVLERDLAFPLRLAAISKNGVLLAIGFEYKDRGCETTTMLADPRGAPIELPLNVMLCDSAGKRLDAVVASLEGETILKH